MCIRDSDALEREMRRNLMTLTDEQHDVFMEALARRNRCNSVEEMYAAIGYGGLQILSLIHIWCSFPRCAQEKH